MFATAAGLIYWPNDLLMCLRLHAAPSARLEPGGLASLGAHTLKLLTFPNLFPSLLIVMKNWTESPNAEKLGRRVSIRWHFSRRPGVIWSSRANAPSDDTLSFVPDGARREEGQNPDAARERWGFMKQKGQQE